MQETQKQFYMQVIKQFNSLKNIKQNMREKDYEIAEADCPE